MGQEQSQNSNANNNHQSKDQIDIFPQINLSKSLFEFLYVIGRGGFGKVWKVNLKRTQKCYALKEMSKLKIILRRSEKSIQSERELLSDLYHPFLVNMICAFQDYENLYLVMDLFKGGDLRYHIFINKKFTESQSKFFCANVILGLEYIHNHNIIHRDIKPENLVLDSHGYLAITDFGVAKKNAKNNSSETSGTPGYMAPEVLCSLNHSFYVDFYAVGVMAYEFMNGYRPYLGRNRKEIKEAVLSKQILVNKKNLQECGWSIEAGDFINRMIQRKVVKRLGYNGINEIKNHYWFKNIDWKKLLMKKINSPFIPIDGDNFDKKFCEAPDNFFDIDEATKSKYEFLMKKKEFRNLFWNYTYIREEEKQQVIQNYYFDYPKKNYENQIKRSYTTSIQGNGKHQLKINNYMSNNSNNNNANENYQILNNENRPIANNNRINYNISPENIINSCKSTNNIFVSPSNNGQVFCKKRASKNSIIIDKPSTNDINNNLDNNNNHNYRNSVIIINPYYNQNINYYSNNNLFHDESLTSKNVQKDKLTKDNSSFHKTKSFDMFLKNYEEKHSFDEEKNKTIDSKKILLKNSDSSSHKKNASNSIQPSSSFKALRKSVQLLNNNNQIDNNFEKDRIIYSPPHVVSSKINMKNKSKNKISQKAENNFKKYISTRNDNIKSVKYYENNNMSNAKSNGENYSTLDYTLKKYNNYNSHHSPSFNLNNNIFKNYSSEKNFKDTIDEINGNKLLVNHINNKSSINIYDNNYDSNKDKNHRNISNSSLNKVLYKKNNATISYSSVFSKNNNKVSKSPSYLYSNSQIMKEKIFNNPNIDNYSFINKNKEQKYIKFENIFNNSNNNSNSNVSNINKPKNSIKKTKQILNNKNNFNKKKIVKIKYEKYNNMNIMNKNIDAKLWSTADNNNNITKIHNFENSLSPSIRNNKENLHDNFFTNIKTFEDKKNMNQIRVSLIPKP